MSGGALQAPHVGSGVEAPAAVDFGHSGSKSSGVVTGERRGTVIIIIISSSSSRASAGLERSRFHELPPSSSILGNLGTNLKFRALIVSSVGNFVAVCRKIATSNFTPNCQKYIWNQAGEKVGESCTRLARLTDSRPVSRAFVVDIEVAELLR